MSIEPKINNYDYVPKLPNKNSFFGVSFYNWDQLPQATQVGVKLIVITIGLGD